MSDEARGNWLCPSALDRERLVDMHARVAAARRVQGVCIGSVSIAASAFLGWWLLGLVAIGVGVLLGLERAFRVTRRPELVSVASLATLEVTLAVAAGGTGGVHSPMLSWLAIPIVMLASRFPWRIVAVGVVVATACTLTAGAVSNRLPPASQAPWGLAVACWVALLISLVAVTGSLLSAELKSRGDAVTDPLTGLGNRLAMINGFEQAAAQAIVMNAWTSVVMCDLDNFKDINDTHGHGDGDGVLRTAASAMQRELRAFDSVYRIGGDEFVVLLPGLELEDAMQLADRLRRAVSGGRVGNFGITVSAGVAAARGAAVVPDTLLRDADQALYAAKRAGRNRVFAASADELRAPANQVSSDADWAGSGREAGKPGRR
jgi:diguanylate cyclase (GGDEF)-like protein